MKEWYWINTITGKIKGPYTKEVLKTNQDVIKNVDHILISQERSRGSSSPWKLICSDCVSDRGFSMAEFIKEHTYQGDTIK